MTRNNYDTLFAIMAVQEVVFFAPIAKRLMEEEGLKVAFLTFHEAGDDILEKEGIPYFSLHKIKASMNKKDFNTIEPEELQKRLGVDVRRLTIHEKLTTNRWDEKYLLSKVATYYTIMDKILRGNNIGCVVQELGGFIAPQMLYHMARCCNINHIFIEPAMFPKRIVYTLNEMYADIPDYGNQSISDSDELKQLVEQYKTKKVVVIPKKDRHFFKDMNLRRLFSLDNFRRLTRKLYHKYIIGRKEEYNAILWYIIYHFIKLFRRKILNLYYSNPVEGEWYIYYPFHVPLDIQLTVRCPEFLNQEALVEYIARCIPMGYKLYIKEHPAAIGGHPISRLRDILKDKNIRLIHPRHNSFHLIKNAACVITINSKVGFEAIMQEKPVVVLGKTFYRGKGVTVDVENISEVADAMIKAIAMTITEKKRQDFLNNAFKWTYPGELYENSHENVDNFYKSLRDFLVKSGAVKKRALILEESIK